MSRQLPGRSYASVSHRAYLLGVKKSSKYMRDLGAANMQAGAERFGRECWEKPLGSLRHEQTRVLIKLGQPDIWKGLHIHAWELVNGPVPDGHIVAAKDGNRKNVSLDNLCLRTVSEHVVKTCPNYQHLPEDLVDVLHLQNEIRKTIKRKRGNEK
ncbi:HNH endonuclease [Pseudomonas asturiensis]|uniref:HNH endonuclease n=1 Tax=Pseudomonas asturiensis TaxID=1190415 RepID=A0ABX6HJC8_9PSED|nr:HNH endonuclease [Pseudomonas asturiensis]